MSQNIERQFRIEQAEEFFKSFKRPNRLQIAGALAAPFIAVPGIVMAQEDLGLNQKTEETNADSVEIGGALMDSNTPSDVDLLLADSTSLVEPCNPRDGTTPNTNNGSPILTYWVSPTGGSIPIRVSPDVNAPSIGEWAARTALDFECARGIAGQRWNRVTSRDGIPGWFSSSVNSVSINRPAGADPAKESFFSEPRVISDNFDNPSNGLLNPKGYIDGEYKIRNSRTDSFTSEGLRVPFRNYKVSVKARISEKGDGDPPQFLLGCRETVENGVLISGYAFAITPDLQFFNLVRFDQGIPVSLLKGNSDSILPGQQTPVGFICNEDTITAMIDDQVVAEVSDSIYSPTSTSIASIMVSRDGEGSFDDLIIKQL